MTITLKNNDISNTQLNKMPVLKLEGIDKVFGKNYALKDVNLEFFPGEVHALVGENGAGKSTLIKIMTGAYTRSKGNIYLYDKLINITEPQDALNLGINAVHQEVVICPHLTVAENIFLGNEFKSFGIEQKKIAIEKSQEILDLLNFEINANEILGLLPIGKQQLVATARARVKDIKLIIFDEPTAYLTKKETNSLFKFINKLKKENVAIVYISHRMEEIFELADKVSVLRDGEHISTYNIKDVTTDNLISDMIGRELTEDVHYKEKIEIGEPILEVKNCSGIGFKDISLTIRKGEIVGLYGLVGAGRSEFALSLFGRTPLSSGTIVLNGEEYIPTDERNAIKKGIALIPESRRSQGLCLDLDIMSNINLSALYDYVKALTYIDSTKEKKSAENMIDKMGVKTKNKYDNILTLSGGNQQKVVIGKWLQVKPNLFIFDEPTAGVDVRTKSEIYQLIAKLLHGGAGVLLISSYLPEVYDLADRLCVFRDGRLISTHSYGTTTHEEILIEALSGV